MSSNTIKLLVAPKALLLFFLLVFLVSKTDAQNLNNELDSYLTKYYKNKNVPSISAGVAKKGKIIWLSSKGYADVENLVPATPNSLYRVASISKSITAVAIMQLVEEGSINLDADVRNYIPGFPTKRWTFTTRQILNHTSGIRDYKSGEFESKEFFNSITSVVNYLSKDSLINEPGTKYTYSTLAYNLLAAIIENVSGLSFNEYLKRKIFEPAGMSSTTIEIQKELVLNRARGYVKNAERKLMNAPLADLSIKYPGGGIISTSEDLLKFSVSLLDGRLIKLSTLDSMLVPLKLKNGETRNYGLGFTIGTDKEGKKYFSHSGGGTGFSSLLIIYPSEKLSAVHLTNLRDRNLGSPASDLAAIAFKIPIDPPKISLADFLVTTTIESGIDSAISAYKKLKSEVISEYDLAEEEIFLFGSDLFLMQRLPDAIIYFRYLVQEKPNSARAFTGLADAYYKDGNIGLAINNYRKAFRLDPSNDYLAGMLRKLENARN